MYGRMFYDCLCVLLAFLVPIVFAVLLGKLFLTALVHNPWILGLAIVTGVFGICSGTD